MTQEPKRRSQLRSQLGKTYYGALRRLWWLKMRHHFAQERRSAHLPHVHFTHATPLSRKLQGEKPELQRNKVTNLTLAAARLDGVVIHPGELFSYWRLIGNPCKRRGYKEGMVLHNGQITAGTGGGLCQLSNLIYWMALHSPLTVVERHHHGYDVFPDSRRTQPFGSGATCSYPHTDLMLRNDTGENFQLTVQVGETHLEGAILGETPPAFRYKIVERDHEMRGEYWGGYTRRNRLIRQVYSLTGELLHEGLAAENCAIMMYSPMLSEKN